MVVTFGGAAAPAYADSPERAVVVLADPLNEPSLGAAVAAQLGDLGVRAVTRARSSDATLIDTRVLVRAAQIHGHDKPDPAG